MTKNNRLLDTLYDIAEDFREKISNSEVELSDLEEAVIDLHESIQELNFLFDKEDTIEGFVEIDRHLLNIVGALDTLQTVANDRINNEILESIKMVERVQMATRNQLCEEFEIPKYVVSRLIEKGYEIETSEDLVDCIEQYGVGCLIKEATYFEEKEER